MKKISDIYKHIYRCNTTIVCNNNNKYVTHQILSENIYPCLSCKNSNIFTLKCNKFNTPFTDAIHDEDKCGSDFKEYDYIKNIYV